MAVSLPADAAASIFERYEIYLFGTWNEYHFLSDGYVSESPFVEQYRFVRVTESPTVEYVLNNVYLTTDDWFYPGALEKENIDKFHRELEEEGRAMPWEILPFSDIDGNYNYNHQDEIPTDGLYNIYLRPYGDGNESWLGREGYPLMDDGYHLYYDRGKERETRYYVKLVPSAEDTHKIDPVKPNTVKVKEESEAAPWNISLNGSFKAPAADFLPIIGGEEFELDLSFIPVSAMVKDGKLYAGINVNNIQDLCTDKQTWCNFKNYVDGYSKKIEKGKDAWWKAVDEGKGGSAGWAGSIDIDAVGYYVCPIKNGVPQTKYGSGMINLKMKASAKKETQYLVYVVPVVVKFSGEVGVDETIDITLKDHKLNFDTTVKVILPKIGVSAGIGLAYVADVSLYGEAKNEFVFYPDQRITGTLYGEVGISVKALMFSSKKVILPLNDNDGLTYYDSESEDNGRAGLVPSGGLPELSADSFEIDRSYISQQSEWLSSPSRNALPVPSGAGTYGGFEYCELQKDIYNDSSPKLLRAGEDIILTFVGDDPSRSTGNETVVYYSLYDAESGLWSAPAAVEDNATADFYPDIATDGENTYITWVDADQSFSEDVTLDEMASACEIKIARFDPDTKTFTNITRLTENEVVDVNPSVAVSNGKATVVWKQNSDNSILQFSGTDKILRACGQNSSFVTSCVYSSDRGIFELATNGEQIAFTADADNNHSDNEDIEVYRYENNEAVQLTDNDRKEYNIAFNDINSASRLTYLCDGVLYSSSDSECVAVSDSQTPIFGNYQFVCDGQKTKLFSVESDESACEIYSYSVDSQGLLGNRIKASDMGSYVKHPAFLMNSDGSVITAFLKTDVAITENDVTERSDLCAGVLTDYSDIAITNVEYDEEDLILGELLPVSLNVENTGTLGIEDIIISVSDSQNNVVYSDTRDNLSLSSGAESEIEISVPISEEMDSLTDYTVRVSCLNDAAYDTSTLTYGYTDLILTTVLGSQDNTKGIVLDVENDSPVSTSMNLLIKASKDADDLIDTLALGEISGYESLRYFLSYDDIERYKGASDTLFFEVVADKNERRISDNSDFLYIGDLTDEVYLRGDTDGDGKVSVLDVTKIQKHLASLIDDKDGRIKLCGTIIESELSILDATAIQKYLALIDSNQYGIANMIG